METTVNRLFAAPAAKLIANLYNSDSSLFRFNVESDSVSNLIQCRVCLSVISD